jgi:uncharacterized membrane protein
MSPTAASYLYSREYENKAFTASLVEMAVKGAINIRCEKVTKSSKKYFLEDKNNNERLLPEEQQIHDTLFTSSKLIEVCNDNHEKFKLASDDLQKAIKKQWNLKVYFRENKGFIIAGGLLLNLLMVLYMVFTDINVVFGAYCFASPFIVLGLIEMFKSSSKTPAGCGCTLIGLGLILMFVVIILALDEEETYEIHWQSALFFGFTSIIYRIYARRLKMFTPDGAKINAELEGLKMYMKTAEEHRLNMLTPPDKTPELFEKLLPYAIALRVSNEWCKKFNKVFKQLNYRPEWYTGDDLSTVGFATSLAALGTSFSSSVSNAQSSPSSSGSSDWSSGSSGGGYSGGGGGGGGGHGW